MLQKTFEDTVFLIGVKPEDRIIEMVTDCDFELVGPIVVKNDQETYRFATLDVRNAHKRFSQLLGNLEKIQGVSIKEFHSSKTEQAPLLKSLIETEQNRQLVRELILSDYFNPSNAKRPTQFELAKKLGISSGKINQMLRYLEYISFNNLLILKPDLKEFRSLLREIDEEEEAATKTKSAEKGKP